MRVYIAGPIAGRPDGNRAEFERAAAALYWAGHEPVNPQAVDHSHEGECTGAEVPRPAGEPAERREGVAHRYGCYMRADLRALMECDAIAFLPGWRESRGARVEEAVSAILGMQEIHLHEIYGARSNG